MNKLVSSIEKVLCRFPNKNDGALAQIIASVVIALLVGGSAPWWWQEFFSREDALDPQPPERIDPIPEPTVSPAPSPQPEPIEPRRTSISVAYRGDYYGCNLPVSISVAGQEFYPDAAIYQIGDIEVGQQQYQLVDRLTVQLLAAARFSVRELSM